MGLINSIGIREKLFFWKLRWNCSLQTETHYTQKRRLYAVFNDFDSFRELNLQTQSAAFWMGLAIFRFLQEIFIDLDPAWAFNSCIHDKELKRSVCSSENIFEVITFPIRCRYIVISEWVSNLVIRSFRSENSFYFKNVLSIFKFAHYNLYVFSFEFFVDLFFGSGQVIFAQLFRIEFFLLKCKV